MLTGRKRFEAVAERSSTIISISDVVKHLDVDRIIASGLLSRWARTGWVHRVCHGAFIVADERPKHAAIASVEPYMIVPAIFHDCYVGGQTAAEYWGLIDGQTDPIHLVRRKPLGKRKVVMYHHMHFELWKSNKLPDSFIGEASIDGTNLSISDVHGTILDLLHNPNMAKDCSTLIKCTNAYLDSELFDLERLIEGAKQFNNGALVKRLGFLAERHAKSDRLIDFARELMTTGHSDLFFNNETKRLVARWGLRVPKDCI